MIEYRLEKKYLKKKDNKKKKNEYFNVFFIVFCRKQDVLSNFVSFNTILQHSNLLR